MRYIINKIFGLIILLLIASNSFGIVYYLNEDDFIINVSSPQFKYSVILSTTGVPNPAPAGKAYLYLGADKKVYLKNEDGTVYDLTAAAAGGNDNLGNHVATTTLNMAGFGITGAGNISATSVTSTATFSTDSGLLQGHNAAYFATAAGLSAYTPLTLTINEISALSTTYLGINAKADDSDLLDGIDSTYFLNELSSLPTTYLGIDGDNLGNHIATTSLLMGGFDIYNSSRIYADHFEVNSTSINIVEKPINLYPLDDTAALNIYDGTTLRGYIKRYGGRMYIVGSTGLNLNSTAGNLYMEIGTTYDYDIRTDADTIFQIGDGTYSWGHTPQVGVEGTAEFDGSVYFDGDVVITEGKLADSTVISADIKDGEVTYMDVCSTFTLASSPEMLANRVYWGTTGIIFEGATANAYETLFTVTDPTADRTITFPDGSITVAGLASAMTGTYDGNNFGGGAIGQGDLLYGSAAGTISELAKDANATRYLSNTGTSNNPAWGQVNLANGVTGMLPYTNIWATVGTTNNTLAVGTHTHTGVYEPAITEGSLPDSSILSADIKDGEITTADMAAATTGWLTAWGNLSNVPAGFADGTDDTGGGGAAALMVSVDEVEVSSPTVAISFENVFTGLKTGNTSFIYISTAAVANGDMTHIPNGDQVYDWGIATFQPTVTEGSLADSTIVSADIKDGTIALADLAAATSGYLTSWGNVTDKAIVTGEITDGTIALGDLATATTGWLTDWNNLSNVPAGFADGTDDEGAGSGDNLGNHVATTTLEMGGNIISGMNSLTLGIDDTTDGALTIYGDNAKESGRIKLYNSVDYDDTEEYWMLKASSTWLSLGAEDVETFKFYSAGNFTATGNIAGATYGSDASVSNAELLYINTLASNAQTQINGKQATVTEDSLADSVIVSADIKDATIALTDLAAATSGYLTNWANMSNVSVTGAQILNDTIDSADYAAGSIDNEHLAANSIDSDQYIDGSIDIEHLSAATSGYLTNWNNMANIPIDYAVSISSPNALKLATGYLISPIRSYAYTISSCTLKCIGGTNAVGMIEQRALNAETSAGTDVFSGDITATSVWVGGTIADGTVPANYGLFYVPTSSSGDPSSLMIRYQMRHD